MEHESDEYTNCNLCSWYSHQRIIKGTGGLEDLEKTGRVETIQTTALVRSARIPRRVQVLRRLVLHSHIHEYGHVRNKHRMFITIVHIKNIGISEFENT